MKTTRRVGLVLGVSLAMTLAPAALSPAAPRSSAPRVDPGRAPEVSSAVERVRPAVVGVRASIPPDRPSAQTLGTERWGSAAVITADGLAVTVGYIVLEAAQLEVVRADGRTETARVVGHDFESGLALIRLDGSGPYPTVTLGRSAPVAAGQPVSIVGMSESQGSVAVSARVRAIQPFVAYWEYLLEQALLVAPQHPAFGGAALVDADGSLVGVVSLRLPDGHLAIPIDLLAPVREALVTQGRPARPPRPWLGVRAVTVAGGVGIAGVSPRGPAQAAGLQPGDVVVRLDGDRVADVEDFYRRLWRTAIGYEVELTVLREGRLTAVRVRPEDRYRVFRFRVP